MDEVRYELKGRGYNYFNLKGGTLLYKTKEKLDKHDKYFEIHRKRGIECIRYDGMEEVGKIAPETLRSKYKHAGCIFVPSERNIDLFDFGKRIS